MLILAGLLKFIGRGFFVRKLSYRLECAKLGSSFLEKETSCYGVKILTN
jgi:hypothetical protein